MDDGSAGYTLDRLGWLQFEQLASLVLGADAGLGELSWRGRAYRDRMALVDESVVLAGSGLRVKAPFVVAVAWVRDRLSLPRRQAELASQVARSASDLGLGGAVNKARDVWAHQDVQFAGGAYRAPLPSHGVLLLRVSGK